MLLLIFACEKKLDGMTSLIENRVFVGISSFSLVLLFLKVLSVPFDPRVQHRALTADNMTTLDALIILAIVFGILLTALVAAAHAFSSGRILWGFANVIFWPTSYVYVWLHYRHWRHG